MLKKRKDALFMVREQNLHLRTAARACGISHTALARLVQGATKVDTQQGRPPDVLAIVEEILVKKLERLVEAHMSVDLAMLPLIAKDIARKLKLSTLS